MNLPELPEGYYYRFIRSGTGSSFDRVALMRKRRLWFDQKVAVEYAELLQRFPGVPGPLHSAVEVLKQCK